MELYSNVIEYGIYTSLKLVDVFLWWNQAIVVVKVDAKAAGAL